MPNIIDAPQRARALDYRTSFAVTAPAGSGKTELLIQRTLTLLAQVENPEEILAITFTRKAANEMRSRILGALQDGFSDIAPTEPHKLTTWTLSRAVLDQDKHYNWRLLDNPNRLRIQTIDSFCMQLVQRMPIMSKLGAEASINPDPQSQYQQAARHFLARLEEDAGISTDLQQLLTHLDNDTARIERLLCSILNKREQWLRHFMLGRQTEFDFQGYLESCLEQVIEENLMQMDQALSNFKPALMEALNFACTQLVALNPDARLLRCKNLDTVPGPTVNNLPKWQAMTDLLLKKDDAFRARLTKNEGFPTATEKADKARFKAAKQQCLELINELADCPGMLGLLQEVRYLPAPHYDDKQWRLLDTLTRLLPTLVAELSLVFMADGQVDYTQISIAASMALGHEDRPSDIALRLDYQLKHILVDEFQDTSAGQFSLLARLTEGWEADDGRTLFIVGDGMQSCYGFREANVGLFLAAREFGIGNVELEPVDLSVNFRSDGGIVNWVNEAFSEAFPAQDNIARSAVSYSPSAAIHQSDELNSVQFYGCIEQQSRTIEAAQITQLVQQTLRDYHSDSIAILVRNRSHLQEIIPALRQANIVWSAVDIDPLAQRPLISDLLALTQALLNPADQVSWLAILRAPWCGLSLTDLHQLASNPVDNASPNPTDNNAPAPPQKPTQLWQVLYSEPHVNLLSSEGEKSLNRLINIIKPAISFRHRKPLRQWIEGVWLSLGGPLIADSEQELAQASAFFDLLSAHETGGDLRDIEAFKAAVTRLYAQPETSPDIRVHIMTIHKSKGLEFDHVIIPGLDRTNRSATQELLLWHEGLSVTGEPLLLMGSIPEKKASNARGDNLDDALYNHLKREQRLKSQLENTRLLYVGATRAVKRLMLLANLQENVAKQAASDSLKAPAENSLLYSLWPKLKHQVKRLELNLETQPSAQQTLALQETVKSRRLSCDWLPPTYPRCDLLAPYRGHEYNAHNTIQSEANNQDISADLVRLAQEATRRQDCLQQLLLGLCQQGSAYWLTAEAAVLESLIHRYMRQAGCNPAQIIEAKGMAEIINRVLQDEQGRWLLSNEHQQARTQWQLNQRLPNGDVNQLPIKRSFIADGQAWLIDFDLSAAVEQRISEHTSAQLQAGISALTTLLGLPVRAGVYFVGADSPRFIELL